MCCSFNTILTQWLEFLMHISSLKFIPFCMIGIFLESWKLLQRKATIQAIHFVLSKKRNCSLLTEVYVAPTPCDKNSSCLMWSFETVNGWHTFNEGCEHDSEEITKTHFIS